MTVVLVRREGKVVPVDIEAAVTRAGDALEAEIKRRDEWYGLDNWTVDEVARFVFEHGLKA